jgi:meso-butanediol dehydrogenase/(S,S)-butanediol dehydrogenase/diacetyl reductase
VTAGNAPGRFEKKVVVITGTAGGQGRAAALAFAHEGAIVVGCDVNIDGSRETVALVEATGGVMFSTHPIDLTDAASVEHWVTAVIHQHGRIDVVYANAGATRFAPVDGMTAADWSWVLRHELDTVFYTVSYAWPHLKESSGSVILVGSTAGVSGSMTNTRVAHTATKGGVVAMTKQLAAEGAPFGIRVNCVSPGMIRTPATEGDLLAEGHPMREIASAIPLGRIGRPEEVVSCALFLASDDASYVTGANLMVDGGWSAVLPG